jgi:ATP-dependent DNA helicase 2 subunit 2
MASKEATAYIIDLGASMAEKRHGRDVSDLDWAMEYVWDKITTTVREQFTSILRVLIAGRLLLDVRRP